MLCGITKTTDPILADYIKRYGQTDGLKKFLNNEPMGSERFESQVPTEEVFNFAGNSVNSEIEEDVTGDVEIKNPMTELIMRLKSQIDLDKKKMLSVYDKMANSSERRKKIAELSARIKQKQQIVDRLESKRDFNQLKETATKQFESIQEQLNRMEKALSKNLYEKDLVEAMDILSQMDYWIRTWSDIQDLFGDLAANQEDKDFLTNMGGKFQDLRIKQSKLLLKGFVKYSRKTSYSKNFTEADIKEAIADESAWQAGTGSMARSNSKILQIVEDIVQLNRDRANVEFMQAKDNIKNVLDEFVKATGLKEEDAFELLLEKDKNGRWTGNLINSVSPEYRIIAEEMLDDAKRRASEGDYNGLKEYSLWLAQNNTFIDWDDFLAWRQAMKSGKSYEVTDPNFSEEDYIKQNELLDRYYEDYETTKQYYIEEGLDATEIAKKMKEFTSTKAPGSYLNAMAIMKKNGGYAHVNSGAYVLNGVPNSKWKNKDFAKFDKNGIYHKNYEDLIDILNTYKSYLPSIYTHNLKENFLPEVAARHHMFQSLGAFRDFFVDAVAEKAEEDTDRTIEIAGKKAKSIPVSMIHKQLDVEKRSKDLRVILTNFANMAINYEYMNKILPIAEASKDILETVEEEVLTARGKVKKNKYGIRMRPEDSPLYYTRKHLKNTIDAYFYGETRNKGKSLGKKFIKKEDQVKKDELDAKLASEEITQKEYDEAITKLEYDLTIPAITDSLIKWTYIKALSFPNFVAPTVNLLFGIISNFTHSATGIDFTDKEASQSLGIMLSALTKKLGGVNRTNVEKVFAWMERLNVLGQINETLYSHKATLADKLVFLQMNAEKVNQGMVMIAMLKHQKVKDVNGNEIPLWEAYKVVDGKLTWDSEKMGIEEQPADQTEIVKDSAVNLYRFGRKVTAVIGKLHGDYTSPMGFKKTALGRILLLFRTWIPEAIEERFGSKRDDSRLGREVKGRYLSFISATTKEGEELGFGKVLNILGKSMYKGKKAFEELSDTDKENFIKDMRELHMLLVLLTVALILKNMGTDDDDEKETTNVITGILGKVTQDMSAYIWPQSFIGMMKNPIPIARTVMDAGEILPIAYQTFTGDAYMKNGPFKKQLRIKKWALQNIPGIDFATVRLPQMMENAGSARYSK